MKAIDLKMMIMDLQWQVFEKGLEERRKTQKDIFDVIDGLNELIEDQKREIDYLSGQLEAANNDLKKAYEEKAALEEQLHPRVDDDSRLDPADYADLPFPEIEGGEE